MKALSWKHAWAAIETGTQALIVATSDKYVAKHVAEAHEVEYKKDTEVIEVEIRRVRPGPACTAIRSITGGTVTCRDLWPTSRAAWCTPCLEWKDSEIVEGEIRRVERRPFPPSGPRDPQRGAPA